MKFFQNIPLLPVDAILGLPILFENDARPNKVNLGVGNYRTAEGSPLILNCVRKAENYLIHKNLNKEYLPIDGNPEFIKLTMQLIFGKDSHLFESGAYFAAQTIGGTGALRLGSEFLTKLISRMIFIPQPTWPNHKHVFERSGFTVGSYPYFDYATNKLDFEGMVEALENVPAGSVFLLHACCHNPTGVDPTIEEWQKLSQLMLKRHIIPFFDFAYQGFGENLEADAAAVRLFFNDGHEMLVAYSFSKNMGLYGERIGLLAIITQDSKQIPNIASQIKSLIRGNYSSPQLHGERIVATILKSIEFRKDWENELNSMCMRVREMRSALVSALHVRDVNKKFNIGNQKGLFSFIGLNKEQVELLIAEWGVYVPGSGRINLAGLNSENIEYVADSIASVMKRA